MKRDISKKRLISHPIEKVWDCLTKPELLTWLNDAEIDFKEGGKLKFKNPDETVILGEILTIQEPINFAYSWVDPGLSFTSYVWWKLMDKNGKTLLEFEHSGFKGIRGIIASYSYQGFWRNKLKRLESRLNEIAQKETES